MDTSKVLLWNVPEIQSRPSLFLVLQNCMGSWSASVASSSNRHTSLVPGSGVGEHWGCLKNSLHDLGHSLVGTTDWSLMGSLDSDDPDILWDLDMSVVVLQGTPWVGNLLVRNTWMSIPLVGIPSAGMSLEGIPYVGTPLVGVPVKYFGSNEPTQNLPSSARL